MLKHLIEDELLLLRHITPGPQDTNLLGQKRKGISKAHISYILCLKKNMKDCKKSNLFKIL